MDNNRLRRRSEASPSATWSGLIARVKVVLFATLIVVAGLLGAPAQSASASSTTFSDVPSTHQFAHEITWLADRGVSRGWRVGSRNEFRPAQAVTRDAMAAFLYRLAGQPAYTPARSSPFRDVPTSHQFYKEIAWLADSGISTGWSVRGAKEFRPSNRITRDAMAAFLYRFERSPSYSPSGASPFRDVSASSAFYKEIRWLAASGISTGSNLGHGCREFKPSADVSRDAMAAFMYRLVNGGTSPITENNCNPPPIPLVSGTVSSGAFCAADRAGWYGYTTNGVLMQCKTSSTDSRLRWRAV